MGRLLYKLHPQQVHLSDSRARGDAQQDSGFDSLIVLADS